MLKLEVGLAKKTARNERGSQSSLITGVALVHILRACENACRQKNSHELV
jgi:hypothetical protein